MLLLPAELVVRGSCGAAKEVRDHR
jgi:hypothetical protein